MSRSPAQFDPKNNVADLERAWSLGMDDGSGDGGGAVPAAEAGYLPPDQGPFECANCVYFVSEGQPCQKVSDPVQSEGVCKLFESAGAESQQQEHGEGASPDIAPPQSASI